jgi:hypothetical protein
VSKIMFAGVDASIGTDQPLMKGLLISEIAINLLCDKDIDDDVMTSRMSFLILNRY